MTTTRTSDRTTEEVAERVFTALLGTFDVIAIHLGDRLGWYRSLVDDGPATAAQLAQRTETHPRYTREWLEQQAVTGLLQVQTDGEPESRVYGLDAATAEVLTDPQSLDYLAPIARMICAVGPALPRLLEAYRTGGGVSWDDLGDDARESQGDANRPWFEKRLAQALAGVEEVHQALSRPGVRVLDVGCGHGWSSIALARAYPGSTVQGIDIDEPSVRTATAHAEEAGVADRASFTFGDAAALPAGTFDVAFAFECVHDMPRPVEVLASVRRSLTPNGFMVVMDEAVAEEFAPDGDDLERLMYGYSILICLPDGMSSPPSVGTGTVMRESVLRGYATEAGFADTAKLPVEEFGFWRFYRLG
jgi:SAM-dependent methyltransferase